MTHNKLPWRTYKNAGGVSVLSDGGTIAKINFESGFSKKQDEENAEFIVKAVNAYHEMLNALDTIFHIVDGDIVEDETDPITAIRTIAEDITFKMGIEMTMDEVTVEKVQELLDKGFRCQIVSGTIENAGNLYEWLEYAPLVFRDYQRLQTLLNGLNGTIDSMQQTNEALLKKLLRAEDIIEKHRVDYKDAAERGAMFLSESAISCIGRGENYLADEYETGATGLLKALALIKRAEGK